MKLPLIALILFLLPGLAHAAGERPSQIKEGILQVSILTDLNGEKCKEEYELQISNRLFQLKFRGVPPKNLRSGQRVRFRGRRLNAKKFLIGSKKRLFEVSADVLPAAVIGPRTVLIVKVQSDTATSAVTDAQLIAGVDKWNSRFLEYSYNAVSLDNDLENDGVPDIYTIRVALNTSGVSESIITSLCSTAMNTFATTTGKSLSSWNHKVCVVPPDINFPWFGRATLSGTNLYINGNYAHGYPDGWVHEFGHNLGMHHANQGTTEYGDHTCIMGGNAGIAPRHFNAPHMAQMGWLTPNFADSGTYQLNALELTPAERVAPETVLTIFDAVAGKYLFISYRARFGAYSTGPIVPLETAVHEANGLGSYTYLLATLADGESFSRNSINITQTSHTDRTSTVVVNLVCTLMAPTVTISGSGGSGGNDKSPESSLTYTVLINNNNTSACTAETNFDLAASLPSGWSGVFGATTLTIPRGSSAITSFTLTPGASVTPGRYSISVWARPSGHPELESGKTISVDYSGSSARPLAPANFRRAQ